MSFWSSIGDNIGKSWDSAVNSTVNSIMSSPTLDLFSSSQNTLKPILSQIPVAASLFNNITSSVAKSPKTASREYAQSTFDKFMEDRLAQRLPTNNDPTDPKNIKVQVIRDDEVNKMADILGFKIPNWSYADFINERAIFQKSLFSLTTEPAWFYFKIFFNFNTQYGLFGGLLNNEKFTQAANSAAKYLYYARELYTQERADERIEALHKFASILSYINTNSPWFFKSVRGLNNVSAPLLNEFSKQKTIEIECNVDAIDMRLTTLMDLYKFAVYDDINCKEIIPENLRKFDMSVILFQTPLRYFHTSTNSRTHGKTNYKSLNPTSEDYSNVMSFKMFTFINCEIMPESLGAMTPTDVNNEKPFQGGKGTIKIMYDRVYQHTMNEFMGMLFGSDGFYYNTFSLWSDSPKVLKNNQSYEQSQIARYKALQDSIDNYNFDKNSPESFKQLVDASEAICGHNLMETGGNVFGNIAGGDDDLQFRHFDSNNEYRKSEQDNLLDDYKKDYYKYKLKRIKNFAAAGRGSDVSSLTKLGASFLLGLIGSSYDVMSSKLITSDGTQDGFIAGHALTGIRRRLKTGDVNADYQLSKYFKDKLKALKSGFINKFSELPQNQQAAYLVKTNEWDPFSDARHTDLEMNASISDSNTTHISGAKDTGITHRLSNGIISQELSKYFKDKLKALKSGFDSNNTNASYITGTKETGIRRLGNNQYILTEYFKAKIKNLKTDYITNFGALPQNNISKYIDNNTIQYDVFSQAMQQNDELNQSLKDENNTHIAGYKNTGIKRVSAIEVNVSDYFKDKLDALKNGYIANLGTLPQHNISKYQYSGSATNYSVYDNAVATGNASQLPDLNLTHLSGAKEHEQIQHSTNNTTGTRSLLSTAVITDYLHEKLSKYKQQSNNTNNDVQSVQELKNKNRELKMGSRDLNRATTNEQRKTNNTEHESNNEHLNYTQSNEYKEKLSQLKTGHVDVKYLSGTQATGITHTMNEQVLSAYFREKLNVLKNNYIAETGTLPQNQINKYQHNTNGDFDAYPDNANNLQMLEQIKNLNLTHLSGIKNFEQLKHYLDETLGNRTLLQSGQPTQYFHEKLQKLKQ